MATTNAMTPAEIAIVTAVIAHEADCREAWRGRALPNNSFFKSLALDICRKYSNKMNNREGYGKN